MLNNKLTENIHKQKQNSTLSSLKKFEINAGVSMEKE